MKQVEPSLDWNNRLSLNETMYFYMMRTDQDTFSVKQVYNYLNENHRKLFYDINKVSSLLRTNVLFEAVKDTNEHGIVYAPRDLHTCRERVMASRKIMSKQAQILRVYNLFIERGATPLKARAESLKLSNNEELI